MKLLKLTCEGCSDADEDSIVRHHVESSTNTQSVQVVDDVQTIVDESKVVKLENPIEELEVVEPTVAKVDPVVDESELLVPQSVQQQSNQGQERVAIFSSIPLATKWTKDHPIEYIIGLD